MTGDRDNEEQRQQRERKLAAVRAARYRARKAGEAVPLAKPGPAKSTAKQRQEELKRLREENAGLRQRVQELEAQSGTERQE